MDDSNREGWWTAVRVGRNEILFLVLLAAFVFEVVFWAFTGRLDPTLFGATMLGLGVAPALSADARRRDHDDR